MAQNRSSDPGGGDGVGRRLQGRARAGAISGDSRDQRCGGLQAAPGLDDVRMSQRGAFTRALLLTKPIRPSAPSDEAAPRKSRGEPSQATAYSVSHPTNERSTGAVPSAIPAVVAPTRTAVRPKYQVFVSSTFIDL